MALGGVLFAMTAFSGRAAYITVQELSVNPYETPTITCTGIGTVTVYAGVNKLVVDGTPMDGFCIDPFHYSLPSSSGYQYVALENAPKEHTMGAQTAMYIRRLWASYYSPDMTAENAAGLQIAIWELVGGNDFTMTGNLYGADKFLEAVKSSSYEGEVADLIGLTGPGQDYVVRNVPETASTLVLLALGMTAVVVASRKFKLVPCAATAR